MGEEVDPARALQTIYSVVLRILFAPFARAREPRLVVGRYGRNGEAIEQRLDDQQRRAAEAAAAAGVRVGAARVSE